MEPSFGVSVVSVPFPGVLSSQRVCLFLRLLLPSGRWNVPALELKELRLLVNVRKGVEVVAGRHGDLVEEQVP